jgi:hypothetical protein
MKKIRRNFLLRPYRLGRIWDGVPLTPPVVISLTPATGAIAGGTAITDLAGTGFQAGATVKLGGHGGVGGTAAAAVVFVSPTKLTCATPAGKDSGAITADVAASLGTFTRSAGSYLADGFLVGQVVAWSGFAAPGNNTIKTILALSATVMTTSTAGLVDELGDADERVILSLADVVVTNPDTTESGASGFGLFAYTAVAPFDPATLDLDFYFDGASYVPASGAWPSLASAGISGNAIQSMAPKYTGKPTAGTQGGLQTALFTNPLSGVAASQVLQCAVDMAYVPNAVQGSVWALLKYNPAHSVGSPLATAYNNQGIYCESNARFNLVSTSGKAQIILYDGSFPAVEVVAADSTWLLVQAKWDSATLKIRVNGGAWGSVACGAIVAPTRRSKLGESYGGADWEGELASVGVSPVAFSDATFDNIRTSLGTRWGLSL